MSTKAGPNPVGYEMVLGRRSVKRSDQPCFIVGIGGSAGGLPAYRSLLATLPPDTGMAFVFIAHLAPDEKSWLTEILSRSTQMPVLQAAASMPIQANHVYVIPPNADLLVARWAFKVVSPRTMHGGRHHQVDLFLTSLADAVGSGAVGVIFSGGDGDGTEGCLRIKAKGGRTFAQDRSAEVDSMPLNAIASGCVDAVLSPIELSKELVRMAVSATS